MLCQTVRVCVVGEVTGASVGVFGFAFFRARVWRL